MGLGRVKERPVHWRSTRIMPKSGLRPAGRGWQFVKQHPINRFILGNIRYVPKKLLGNSNMRMTTPGSGSNTPRFISVAFLTDEVVSPTWLRLAMELRFEVALPAASADRSANNEA